MTKQGTGKQTPNITTHTEVLTLLRSGLFRGVLRKLTHLLYRRTKVRFFHEATNARKSGLFVRQYAARHRCWRGKTLRADVLLSSNSVRLTSGTLVMRIFLLRPFAESAGAINDNCE